MALVPLFVLAALAPVVAGSGTIVFHDAVRTNGQAVRLGDVADLRILPGPVRSRAASLILIDAGTTQAERSVLHRVLAERARARMPGLRPWLAPRYAGSLDFVATQPHRAEIVAVSERDEAVVAGDTVTTRARAGIFTIERRATALQAAKSGQRFFVRTTDGVMAVECCRGER